MVIKMRKLGKIRNRLLSYIARQLKWSESLSSLEIGPSPFPCLRSMLIQKQLE